MGQGGSESFTDSSVMAVTCAVLLLMCLSSSLILIVTPQEVVQLKITAVFDQSIINLDSKNRSLVQCKVVDSVVYWLNEVLRVDNSSTHSLPYNRQCPYGYYYEEDTSRSATKRYCHKSCSNKTKCGPVIIPEHHLKACSYCNAQGECHTENQTRDQNGNQTGDLLDQFNGTHYVLYVSAINTLECNATGLNLSEGKQHQVDNNILNARTCLQDKHTDRPVAGYLNFCPGHLGGKHSFTRMLSYVLQELIGALGFSKSLMPFFRGSNSNPLMPRGQDGLPRRNINGEFVVDYIISKTFIYNNWTNARPVKEHKVKMITLRKVAIEASKHFGCPNMTGMLVEDQHPWKLLWESRVFWGEIMTDSWDSYREPVVSRVTLALLEGTGWYYPKYKHGFTLHWGLGKGCGFVNQSCLGWTKDARLNNRRLSPFCMPWKRQPVKGCTGDHTHFTTSSFTNYTHAIPRPYQYWKFSSQFGGNVPLSDYCPFYNTVSRKGMNCAVPKKRTGHEESPDYFYPDSKCIETSKPWKVLNTTSKRRYKEKEWGAGCYKIECTDDVNKYYVYIGNMKVECNETGQLIPIKVFVGSIRYTGEIICPSYDHVCSHRPCFTKCLNGGQCNVKRRFKCHCAVGFEGQTCLFSAYYNQREDKASCTNSEYHGIF